VSFCFCICSNALSTTGENAVANSAAFPLPAPAPPIALSPPDIKACATTSLPIRGR